MNKDFGELILSVKPEGTVEKKGFFSFLKKNPLNEAYVYERGLRLKSKAGEREIHFSELLGIYDSVQRHATNAGNARNFQVEVRDEKQNSLFDYLNYSDLRDFGVVADTITDAYTDFLLKGLTKENIQQAEIRFHDKLVNIEFMLKDGKFKYGQVMGKKSTTQEIDAKDITSVKISPGIIELMHLVKGKEKRWVGLPLEFTFNIRALYIVVNSILQA